MPNILEEELRCLRQTEQILEEKLKIVREQIDLRLKEIKE